MSFAHIAPVVARVDCSDATHALRWADGELEALDHPDPEAERALTALGGEPCRCVQLLDAWQRCRADPRALVLGPRVSDILPPVTDRGPRQRPGQETATDPLLDLLGLGGALPRRLVATVAAALLPRAHEPSLRAQLHSALYGRLLVSLSRWLGAMPTLDLAVIGPDAAPSLSHDGDILRARVALSWLVDVWSPGLDVVWGRFTLAASPHPSGGVNLLMVDPQMTVNRCTLSPS